MNRREIHNELMIGFIFLVVILLTHWFWTSQAESNAKGKIVTANGFVLLDKSGKERARLEVNGYDEACLVLMDGKSKGKALIGWTMYGPRVELYSKDGTRQMDAGIEHNGVAYCRLKGNNSFYSILREDDGEAVLVKYYDVSSQIELHGESHRPSLTLTGGLTPTISFGGNGNMALFSMGLDENAKRPEFFMADPLLNYQFNAAKLMAAVYYVEQVMTGKK